MFTIPTPSVFASSSITSRPIRLARSTRTFPADEARRIGFALGGQLGRVRGALQRVLHAEDGFVKHVALLCRLKAGALLVSQPPAPRIGPLPVMPKCEPG